MKTCYTTTLFVCLSLWVIVAQGQVKIGFEEKEITTIESKKASIPIRFKIEGKWLPGKDKVKVALKAGGNASKDFDYTISSEEFELNQKNLATPIITIAILDEEKFDNEEFISLTLSVSDDTVAQIDPLFNILRINIKDENPSPLDIINQIISNDKDTSEVIGKLIFKNLPVISHYLKKSETLVQEQKTKAGTGESIVEEDRNIEIEKVEVAFQEGVLVEIKATAKKRQGETLPEIYINTISRNKSKITSRYPIPIRYQTYNKEIDLLPLYGSVNQGNRQKFIYFGDVLRYEPAITLNYPPSDLKVTLSPKEPTKVITTKTALNNYINLNIYTDFLSLIKAEKGNGLIQTEASARVYMNTYNKPLNFIFWFNYLEPSVKYSRFDVGYNFVVPENNVINRMLLNQRSFLVTGLKTNVYKKINPFYSTFEANAFFNINWANARGKLISDNTNETPEYQLNRVNLYAWGLEGKINIPQHRNFGVTLGGTLFGQTFFNETKLDASITNTGWKFYSVPEVELYYYPIASSKDKLFLRLRGMIDIAGIDANFLQMQVGFKGQFNFKSNK